MKNLLVVDKNDKILDYKSKKDCHQLPGVFHRAFSVFVFNKKGELLLQKRSKEKPLWPLFWANSCCSHPIKGGEIKKTAEKRLKEELGFTTCKLSFVGKLSYQACFEDKGCEKEITYVFTGFYDGPVVPDKKEVAELKWVSLSDLENEIKKQPLKYSPWLRKIMKKFGKELQIKSVKTTDDFSEVFEIVDLKGKVIGKAKRKMVHSSKKLIHKAVGLILKDKKGRVLLQKRSLIKDLYPEVWTVSASGHVDVLESNERAIVRETKEELGLNLKTNNLRKLGHLLVRAPQETELIEMFCANYIDKQKFCFSKKEVEKVVWLTKKELFCKISKGQIDLTPSASQFFSNKRMISGVFGDNNEKD